MKQFKININEDIDKNSDDFKDEKDKIELNIVPKKNSKFSVNIENDIPNIYLDINVQASILSLEKDIEYEQTSTLENFSIATKKYLYGGFSVIARRAAFYFFERFDKITQIVKTRAVSNLRNRLIAPEEFSASSFHAVGVEIFDCRFSRHILKERAEVFRGKTRRQSYFVE